MTKQGSFVLFGFKVCCFVLSVCIIFSLAKNVIQSICIIVSYRILTILRFMKIDRELFPFFLIDSLVNWMVLAEMS